MFKQMARGEGTIRTILIVVGMFLGLLFLIGFVLQKIKEIGAGSLPIF